MSVKNYKLRIGTRKSPLAVAQAMEVARALMSACDCLGYEDHGYEIVTIDTTGDKLRNHNLAEIGGKGLFLKEIEEELLHGGIDIAVHSMKDMPGYVTDGLVTPCVLERGDPRDVLLVNGSVIVDDAAPNLLLSLPQGARVGTSSSRRKSFILKYRPDLEVVPLRGNVDTRIKKASCRFEDLDAIILAFCGLNRLGIRTDLITEVMSPKVFIPAVGQGAIGIQCSADRDDLIEILGGGNHADTYLQVAAERSFLRAVGGNCSLPLAAYTELKLGREGYTAVTMNVMLGSLCGKYSLCHEITEKVSFSSVHGYDLSYLAISERCGLDGVHCQEVSGHHRSNDDTDAATLLNARKALEIAESIGIRACQELREVIKNSGSEEQIEAYRWFL